MALAGTMALQRGDTAAARAAMEAMPRHGAPSPGGGTREELQTLVLLREVAQAEGDSVRQGPLLEQLQRRAGVTLDAAEVRHHRQSLEISRRSRINVINRVLFICMVNVVSIHR